MVDNENKIEDFGDLKSETNSNLSDTSNKMKYLVDSLGDTNKTNL